ncbi:unnamed protein product [Spirodela intermedia]|uniref:Peroxidase n=1 Tax=Spirodela intermedia TaxID=51605 RepID=A0A7I8JNZ0_SPIIN|nr:unnamed protein product [Spirodela intermedia]CAA6671481.1 unnamed protein product [Spirodela intermedia]
MAVSLKLIALPLLLSLLVCASQAQLSANFYSRSCPNLKGIVRGAMTQAVRREPRIGASIVRLLFHDCFVNGCDASILLDDTSTFTGEKTARPNSNSVRGFNVIDDIKTRVEAACPSTVSSWGPSWTVTFGRRDARTASLSDANSQIPPPFSSLSTLISSFSAKGLSLAAPPFRSRIYNDTNINGPFAARLRANCPLSGGDNNLAPLDLQSPNGFGNSYYQNLLTQRGLLHSDQELFNGGSQDALVRRYSANNGLFSRDFAAAMVKMSAISPLTGTNGEIRTNCRRVN